MWILNMVASIIIWWIFLRLAYLRDAGDDASPLVIIGFFATLNTLITIANY